MNEQNGGQYRSMLEAQKNQAAESKSKRDAKRDEAAAARRAKITGVGARASEAFRNGIVAITEKVAQAGAKLESGAEWVAGAPEALGKAVDSMATSLKEKGIDALDSMAKKDDELAAGFDRSFGAVTGRLESAGLGLQAKGNELKANIATKLMDKASEQARKVMEKAAERVASHKKMAEYHAKLVGGVLTLDENATSPILAEAGVAADRFTGKAEEWSSSVDDASVEALRLKDEAAGRKKNGQMLGGLRARIKSFIGSEGIFVRKII